MPAIAKPLSCWEQITVCLPYLTKEPPTKKKVSSVSSSYFSSLKETASSCKRGATYVIKAGFNIGKNLISTIYKIATLNGILSPSRIAKSVLITAKAVWSVVWPILDLGLSFIPGYSQTKALIKAIPSIIILGTTATMGYFAWRLLEDTGLGRAAADAASWAYNSQAGQAMREAAVSVANTALWTLKEGGKFAFQVGTEYLPGFFRWVNS